MSSIRKLVWHVQPYLKKPVRETTVLRVLLPSTSSCSYSESGYRSGEDLYDNDSDLWDRLPSHGRHGGSRQNSYGNSQTKRFRDGFHRRPNFYQGGKRDKYMSQFEKDWLSDDEEGFSHRSRSRPIGHKYRSQHDEDELNFHDDYFQSERMIGSSREVGSNLKKKEWQQTKLLPLEKNFYVESDSVSQRPEAEVDEFYSSHNIQVVRGERPRPVSAFHEANFPERIYSQLERNGCTTPTPIQSLGWPLALSGKNMVGIAQTGSGKTLGFMLPALIHIKHQRQVGKGEGPVVLVLAPTRELAQQIKSVAIEYGRLLGIRSCSVFGGQSKLVQAKFLSEGPEIVVATPGRLLDFLEMGVIDLDRTSYVVLDEADRMLDMGFEPQIRRVLSQIRPDRQMLMWSATWPKEIQELAHDFLEEFSQVNIGSTDLMANPNIQQIIRVCERRDKFKLLAEELENSSGEFGPEKTLIFAQTKTSADFITHRLRKMRFRALAIHGDKSQMVRDKTLHSFRNGDTHVLVATDVASRGLDVDDIKLVINFDYPNTADDYIHRIGRTARASKTGKAVSFFTTVDAPKAEDLIKVLQDAKQDVPLDLQDMARFYSKFNKGKKAPPRGNPYKRPFKPGFNRRNSW